MAKIDMNQLKKSFNQIRGQVKTMLEQGDLVEQVKKTAEQKTAKIRVELRKNFEKEAPKVKKLVNNYVKELERLRNLIPGLEEKQSKLKVAVEKQMNELEKTIRDLLKKSPKNSKTRKAGAAVKKASRKTSSKKKTTKRS